MQRASGRHRPAHADLYVADGSDLDALRCDPLLLRLVPDLPHADDLLWQRGRVAHLHPPRLLPQLVALADVPVAVGRPDHVRDRRVLLVHGLAVDLLRSEHLELAHLVLVEVAHGLAEHLDAPRADGGALDVGRLVQALAVAHPPRGLRELWCGRRVAHAQPALRLAQLVLPPEIPVAGRVPEQSVLVPDLGVDRPAVELTPDQPDELAELVRVEGVGRLAGHHHGHGPDWHALDLFRVDHLLAVGHSPVGLAQLGARRIVLAAKPPLRLPNLRGLADVPVLVDPPDGSLGAIDRLVDGASILEAEAAPDEFAELVLVEPMRSAPRVRDALRADGHGLKLVCLLPLAVRAVPNLPVGDPLGRDGLAHRLVPAPVLTQLVALADVPRASRCVPHHHIGHTHHLIDAALRHHAQLHAPVLAELVLEQLVGGRAVDVHARRRAHCDALDVAPFLPNLLRRNPNAPHASDLSGGRGVAFHLKPTARLPKLLTSAHIPRRPIQRNRKPKHMVRVVVLKVGRPVVHRATRANVLAQLVLVDLYAVELYGLASNKHATHFINRCHRKCGHKRRVS
mmetsp:Transcript_21066/g.45214  ORF Transcript_21066/g.45214 Transcript_21066/m.45214 type:complete len:568 (-) Transcript_21066:198-1901(-)